MGCGSPQLSPLPEEGSGVRGSGSLPVHPHVDLRHPESLVDYGEESTLTSALQMQAVSTHPCWQHRRVLTLAEQPGYLRHLTYFAILKKKRTLNRMLDEKTETLRMEVGTEAWGQQLVRVWAPYQPTSFPTTWWMCRPCWGATAQVQEWSSEVAFHLISNVRLSIWDPALPAIGGSLWEPVDLPGH